MTQSPTLTRSWRLSLNRKLGLLYLGLVLLLVTVCVLVITHILIIREDSRRLLEESREVALTSDLDAELQSIDALLQLLDTVPAGSPVLRSQLRQRMSEVQALLLRMDAGPTGAEDPSRDTHQQEELELTATLGGELRALSSELREKSGDVDEEERRMVAHMRALGGQLAREAREETEHVSLDLRRRARRAMQVMAWSVVAVIAALCATLYLVLRTVVLPLRSLRAHADALGRGEFGPAPAIDSGDEIGDLARSFDSMASQVAATRLALEQRVATRTRDLVRAARYADLGVLAAGVAHEINNPLASIASCAEGLERRLQRGQVERKEELDYLRTIASEAYRARDITSRLLALARHDPPPATRVDLALVLQELELMTKHQLEKKRVRLAVELPALVPAVQGNAGELLQALVNLVLNARDASPPGSTVRVGLGVEEDAVLIDVDDEGPGVPPEIMERIFEPFFTTKAPGQGTGLGLSLVAAIVEGHGGSIALLRSPGGGARFRLRLPMPARTGVEERV